MESASDMKARHEKAVCERFLFEYSLHRGVSVMLQSLGDPGRLEPDGICSHGVGIELVDVFANEYQAALLWSFPRERKVRKDVDCEIRTGKNLEDSICAKLQKLGNGNYKGSPAELLLLCNIEDPLTTDDDVTRFVDGYVPFKQDGYFKSYFHEVWIMWRSKSVKTKIRRIE